MSIKICVVGERGVGKSSLIQRYVKDRFSEEYEGTLGAHLCPVDVQIPLDRCDVVSAKVAVFDLMGEHSSRESFRDAMFYETDAILAVCDIERPETLYELPKWIRAVSIVTSGVPFIVALNKVDRAGAGGIGTAETSWLRKEFPMVPTFLTSARSGSGVEEVFARVLNLAVDRRMELNKQRQQRRVLRHQVLAFVFQKGFLGASKTELFAKFRDTAPDVLMDELDNLVCLDLLMQEESRGGSFVRTASMPVSFRFTATSQGQRLASSPTLDDLVIYE
jgi:Ras-related protein Rab-7A